jgi:hypothetical protein
VAHGAERIVAMLGIPALMMGMVVALALYLYVAYIVYALARGDVSA